MTRRNHDADTLSARLDKAAEIIPIVFDHLDEQRALVAALPARGEGGRQGGTHSDPALAAVMQLAALDLKRTAIIDALESTRLGVKLLREACEDALGFRAQRAERSDPEGAAAEEPRCAGGDPSSWGNPECGAIVDWRVSDAGHVSYNPDGLCPRHLLARKEWEHTEADKRQQTERAQRERKRYHAAKRDETESTQVVAL